MNYLKNFGKLLLTVKENFNKINPEMNSIEHIRTYEQIKTLADPRRLAILRLLMAKPATLTQLGRALGEHPAWVRHHLKLLEQAGLVEISDVQVSDGYVEKYYRARAQAFFVQEMILPDDPEGRTILLLGSHDIALEILSQHIRKQDCGVNLLVLPVGSLEGLTALRQDTSQITGCHLLDIDSGQYNLPYVRHFFPDRPMVLVTLAHREQGLMVSPGNPRRIRGPEDLGRQDLVLANRNRGSGTRLWLDRQLSQSGIPAQQIRGYEQEMRTHLDVAEAVLQGRADVGLGLYAAARHYHLEFIPLFQERYDLVIPLEQYEQPRMIPLFEVLQSGGFRQAVQGLGGYDMTHTGEQIHL